MTKDVETDFENKGLDLLDIGQVYAIPGVRQAGNVALPKPTLDFSACAGRRECPTNYRWWTRSSILGWLEGIQSRRRPIRRVRR